MSENEEWRPILGYERLYEASNLGRVRSLGRTITHEWRGQLKTMRKPQKVLSPYTDKDGYLRFKFADEEGTVRGLGAHQAVALAFIPNPHGLPQVAHLDHNRKNNVLGNLKWATNAENHQDSVVVHRYAKSGPNRGQSITLTAEMVREMRARYAFGNRISAIARAFGMRHETVTKIIRRQRWKHV